MLGMTPALHRWLPPLLAAQRLRMLRKSLERLKYQGCFTRKISSPNTVPGEREAEEDYSDSLHCCHEDRYSLTCATKSLRADCTGNHCDSAYKAWTTMC